MTTNTPTPKITKKLQDLLKVALRRAFQTETDTLLVAPTSIGKTHSVASIPWKKVLSNSDSSAPVIHISQTKQARNEAVNRSEEAGLRTHVIEGRNEVCPVAKGDHDETLIVPGRRESASEWFTLKCDVQNVPFSEAHRELEEMIGDLPCSTSGTCPAVGQWVQYFTDPDSFDIIHVTDTFAYNRTLIKDAYVVFDEQPDYSTKVKDQQNASESDLTRDSVRNSITKFLKAADSDNPNLTWEGLMTAARNPLPDAQDRYRSFLDEIEPDPKWILDSPYVQTSTPAIIEAILNAEDVGNGRFRGEGQLNGSPWYSNSSQQSRRVTVIFDEDNNIRLIHDPPDLSPAKCVVGLDAHPTIRLWEANTSVEFEIEDLGITTDELREWRRTERGLTVYQVGTATRQYTRGWAGDTPEERERLRDRAMALIRAMHGKFGDEFRTCITTKAIHEDVDRMMIGAGIADPEVWYYGNIKSRNGFAGETVGLLIGCNDPGDHNILDTLALLRLYAEPVEIVTEEGETKRDTGREFKGRDAKAADEILQSVREMNVAQAIGRYARSADDPDSAATVYVWTDAIPEELVDGIAPGVVDVLINKQRWIVDYLKESEDQLTRQEIVDRILTERGETVSDEHVRQTLKMLVDRGVAECIEGDYHDPYRYYIEPSASTDVVDLEPAITN